MDFLDYIYINKSFHTLKVCLWFPEEIPDQTHINKEECHNITNKIAERDNNGNITDKWEFKKDRKSTRLNSSHRIRSRMPSSA